VALLEAGGAAEVLHQGLSCYTNMKFYYWQLVNSSTGW